MWSPGCENFPHLAAIILQILLPVFVEGVREEHHVVLHRDATSDFGDGAHNLKVQQIQESIHCQFTNMGILF